MKSGKFIWADLSTYSTLKSTNFYSKVFGWKIENLDNYYLAQNNSSLVAGIFETPDYLKKIKMPHFWMSYFQVESVENAIAIAQSLNGKIEVNSTKFNKGNIALIRDPQGAGFTIYDGNELYLNPGPNSFINTELHVSSVKNVLPFYSKLFNWEYDKIDSKNYEVVQESGKNNIQIKAYKNEVKGTYEYWVTTICVKDLTETKSTILENGGSLISTESNRYLVTDNSGEAFFYISTRGYR